MAAEVSQGAEGAAEIGRGTREQAAKGRKWLQKSVCACDWGVVSAVCRGKAGAAHEISR